MFVVAHTIHWMGRCKISHLALGPSCLSSGLLKSANLRRFSLPLDWAQSGSNQLQDLFALEPLEYYYLHMHRPNIQFAQRVLPCPGNRETADVVPVGIVYGYPFFYNPHRPLSMDREYFVRCLRRLKVLFGMGSNLFLRVLLSDHSDIEAESYFGHDHKQIATFIDSSFRSLRCEFDVTICRIHRSDQIFANCTWSQLTESVRLAEVGVPESLGSSGYEKIVTKLIYKECTTAEYQQKLLREEDLGPY